ncbi:MAG TPA: VanZ family protein [Gemmatimonadaceae bacterium]|jgi:VanZ family protein|nr:VanZ family protein [Gemmatimonadaceae bacterium]
MRFGHWLPALLWAVGVLVITSIPNARVPSAPHLDKVGHFAMYLGLGALVARALRPRARAATVAAATLMGIAAFAALDEVHQRFVPGRSASHADWVADVLGAGVGVLVTTTALRRRELR